VPELARTIEPDDGEIHLRARHESVLNAVLANPSYTQREIAAMLGYTEVWVSRIMGNDLFKAKLRKLTREQQEKIQERVRDKLFKATEACLDLTQKRLDTGVVSDKFLHENTKTLLAAIGFGTAKPAQAPGNELHLHVNAGALIEARQAARTSVPSRLIEAQPAQPAEGDGE
jgi:hypothetical protein